MGKKIAARKNNVTTVEVPTIIKLFITIAVFFIYFKKDLTGLQIP